MGVSGVGRAWGCGVGLVWGWCVAVGLGGAGTGGGLRMMAGGSGWGRTHMNAMCRSGKAGVARGWVASTNSAQAVRQRLCSCAFMPAWVAGLT